MYAPVVTRFMTYDVKLEPTIAAYARRSWTCRRCRSGSLRPRLSPPRSRNFRGRILGTGAACCPFARLKAQAGRAQSRCRRGRETTIILCARKTRRKSLKPNSGLVSRRFDALMAADLQDRRTAAAAGEFRIATSSRERDDATLPKIWTRFAWPISPNENRGGFQ